MVRQCFILFGCLALGELTVRTTGVKLPSSKREHKVNVLILKKRLG